MIKNTKINEEMTMRIVENKVELRREDVLRDLNPITEFCNYPKQRQYENFSCHLNTHA